MNYKLAICLKICYHRNPFFWRTSCFTCNHRGRVNIKAGDVCVATRTFRCVFRWTADWSLYLYNPLFTVYPIDTLAPSSNMATQMWFLLSWCSIVQTISYVRKLKLRTQPVVNLSHLKTIFSISEFMRCCFCSEIFSIIMTLIKKVKFS